MEKKTRPFGVLDQVGYVCGDMAGSFVNLFVDAYFLTFCTYVLLEGKCRDAGGSDPFYARHTVHLSG